MRKVLLMAMGIMLMTSSLLFAAGSAEDGDAKPERYALMMSHMTNAFTMELSDAVKSKAKELGVDLTVFDGGQDVSKQISQVESAINQGYAGILIEPASVDGIKPAAEAAKKAGIPLITVNQRITDQELASAYVGANPVEGGELEMRTAAEAIGGKGKVAFLLGPLGSDAQIGRTQGYYNVLKEYPGIEVAYEQSANWRTDEALKLVENWLQTGVELKAIVANNDGMALGALKAVEDAKMLDKIKIYGLDATPDALAAVKEGRLSATISQSTTEQGLVAMETIVKIVNGEKVPAEIIVGHTLLDKKAVDQMAKN
ncbi:sugar ABC transporter substrate-binding protein [Sediminispirochaeta smaragdinae]|jgi:ribose transport system substrate-binding protein/inositol transport system substrate-binding protein|uniref:Periplasmic binding protein/LacI transcriptional regulator n=1 Tax=Sediminispirochaeta smaragdinae (strain DSM 11293 / JCM 15392 / SEBR 4228) TaxID=573413 RepID=E1R304_SEDSS|nr:sugar ABC transporter substrate-binding protein [Sediminispirochaeta smaragdinae]ADK81190.1 periplasmic binding protein/LacI transcriptional regulator [Sediminispirochaeta smaragdinae DSM 11293]